jgi:hypothetical protein
MSVTLTRPLFISPNLTHPKSKTWVKGFPGSSNKFTDGKAYEVLATWNESGMVKFLIIDDFGYFEWIEYHMFNKAANGGLTIIDDPAVSPEKASAAVALGKKISKAKAEPVAEVTDGSKSV